MTTNKKGNKTMEEKKEIANLKKQEQEAQLAKFDLQACGMTKAEGLRYIQLTANIHDMDTREQNTARAKAGYLAEVREKELWKLQYPSFERYCAMEHGLAKSTVSDAVNTFIRFKDKDKYQIDSKYDNVAWRTLIVCKKLSDDEIDRLDVLNSKTAAHASTLVAEYMKLKNDNKLAPNWTKEDVVALAAQAKADEEKAFHEKIAADAEKKELEDKHPSASADKAEKEGFILTGAETPFDSEESDEKLETTAPLITWNVGKVDIKQFAEALAERATMFYQAVMSGNEIVIKM